VKAIEVENVSKMYHLGVIGYGSLKDDIRSGWRRFIGKSDVVSAGTTGKVTKGNQEFWALKDVSFSVEQGDRVGIIGRNGAGKSTLFKLVSRITGPTTGSIKYRGKVASLLEVGTGFHPELTGRENIFLNGAIMGMRRREIQRKFDEIVDFAGVGEFVDTPVKRYSSGMYVRLAFSVSAHLEADIMVVDEVLAVGDIDFQKKCIGKMENVSQNEGRTILFVSHNLSAISALCNKGVFLEKGRLVLSADVEPVLSSYLARGATSNGHVQDWQGALGDEDIQLRHTWVKPLGGGEFRTDEAIQVGIEIHIWKAIRGLIAGFSLVSGHGDLLAYTLYDDRESSEPPEVEPGTYAKTFVIPANTLAHGDYRIQFDIGVHLMKSFNMENANLRFSLQNVAGFGRRFPISESVRGRGGIFRPGWSTPTS